MMRFLALIPALVLSAPVAWAHPHVFIDAQVAFRLDDTAHLTDVRITWTYDDFTSMTILADHGLPIDASFTEGETGVLSGFDMRWIEGFEGDSYLLVGQTPVALGGPSNWETRVENGIITTIHSRSVLVPQPLSGAEAVLRVYDPTYYTSYVIAAAPVIEGADTCTAQVYGPDPEKANEILLSALAELSGFASDDDFPPIGAEFAEEIRLTCPAP